MTGRDITPVWLGDLTVAFVAAFWPASDEANRPIRKILGIPLNRAMGL